LDIFPITDKYLFIACVLVLW